MRTHMRVVSVVIALLSWSAVVGAQAEYPSRSEVQAALTVIAPAVTACSDGRHGTAQVAIIFDGPTGTVRSATVTGEFAGTQIAACVERAVRGARLPPFVRPEFTVHYPFRL